jgi:hypothetical protein
MNAIIDVVGVMPLQKLLLLKTKGLMIKKRMNS